jgi:hypothetical protein
VIPPRPICCPTYIPPHTSENSIDSFNYSTDEGTSLKPYGVLGGMGSKITLSLEDAGRVIRDVGKELEERGK